MTEAFGLDPNTVAQYPLLAMMIGAIFWLWREAKKERKEIMDRYDTNHERTLQTVDKNTDAITEVTQTNRDLGNAVTELRRDLSHDRSK